MIKNGKQYATDIKEIEKRHVQRYKLAKSLCFSDWNVLDIACGCGYGSFILGEKAQSVVGCDIDEESVQYAKKNWHSSNINFYSKNFKELTFTKVFDMIVSLETVEHIDLPFEKIFGIYKNLLDKEGYILLSHPEKESINSSNKFHYHKNINGEEFNSLFMNSGFEILFDFYQQNSTYSFHIVYGRKK